MSPALFRAQVRAHAQDAWLGRIVLIRPVSFSVFCAIAGLLVLAIVLYLGFGEYTRKARVVGVLAPEQGVVKLIAQQAGVVESIHAREGDAVARDAALLTIVDGRSARNHQDIGAAVHAQLAEREHALVVQERQTIEASAMEQASIAHRRLGLERERAQLDAEIDTQRRRAIVAARTAGRSRELESIGFLSGLAADRDREAAIEQQSRLQSLERSRLGIAREIDVAGLELRGTRARGEAQIAAMETQRAALKQERIERELQYRASIVAPTAGTIAAVLVERGQTVTPGMTLATLVPSDSTLEAQLFTPSRSAGFLRLGQEVQLRYLAYPHQKFGSHPARVVAISATPLLPGEMGFTPPDGAREPMYRLKARLASQAITAYGRSEPLQPGMQVEADVLLDRRRLIEWIFDPLFSLAGRA
ncbi:MAG: HlyD family secretion protein [Betaproteobacteria bacterium]